MTKFNTQQYKVQYTTVHNVQYATLFCYTRIPKLLKQICKVQVIKSNETRTHLPSTEALKLICEIYNKTIILLTDLQSRGYWKQWNENTNAKNKSAKTYLQNIQQGNYSLRRPPKLIIPQIFIEQRRATVYSFMCKQICISNKANMTRA